MAKTSVAIVGPTASGKTRRAVDIALAFSGEIISADSRQVYRGMSIGTGKDIEEYGSVAYHLIDIADAGEKYNLCRFLSDFNKCYRTLQDRDVIPVICGGSGMYVENALSGIVMPEVPGNPELRERLADKSLDELAEILTKYKALHNSTDVDTVKRAIRAIEIQEFYRKNPDAARLADISSAIPLDAVIIGVDIPREDRRRRITERLYARLEQGMVEEVRTLLGSGIKPEDLIYYGLEYKYLTLYVIGELDYDTMVHDLEIAIHQFAKRQMTWFRGMEKRGHRINWLPYDMDSEEFVAAVRDLYDRHISGLPHNADSA